MSPAWVRVARRWGWVVVWMACLWVTPARAVDCLGPAGDARRAGEVTQALALAEAALGEPACQGVRIHLEMLRALALHDIAEVRDERAAWCAARDAFEGLRRAGDAEYAAVAGRKGKVAARGCREEPKAVVCPVCAACPACPAAVDEGVSHWWWTGPGLGLVVAGGVMAGVAVQQHGVAANLRDRDRAANPLLPEEYDKVILAEGNTQIFGGIGIALASAGLVACVTGLVIGLSDDGSDQGASFLISPGGASVAWRFD